MARSSRRTARRSPQAAPEARLRVDRCAPRRRLSPARRPPEAADGQAGDGRAGRRRRRERPDHLPSGLWRDACRVGRAGDARNRVPLGVGVEGRRGDDGRQARRAGQDQPQRAGRELCAGPEAACRATNIARPSATCCRTGSASIATPTTTSWRKGRTRASSARASRQLSATCPPGTCWSYQNIAYDASSEMVAARHAHAL